MSVFEASMYDPDGDLVCAYTGTLQGCYDFLLWQVKEDSKVRRTAFTRDLLDALSELEETLCDFRDGNVREFDSSNHNHSNLKYAYTIAAVKPIA